MIDDDPAEPEDDGPEEQPLPSEQPTVDAASVTAVRRRERKADKERREADEFWRTVLADPVGRREIWRLLADAHAFEERFACGPNGFPQPEATWFHAGEQSFGQRFYLTLARVDRADVLLMHDEHDARFQPAKRKI